MGETFVRRHHLRTARRPVTLHVDFARVKTELSTRTVPNVMITLGNYAEKIIFEMANINHDVILGKPWLSICIVDETVKFDYRDMENHLGPWMNFHYFKAWLNTIQITSRTSNSSDEIEQVSAKRMKNLLRTIDAVVYALTVVAPPRAQEELLVPEELKEEVKQFLEQFTDVFQESLPRRLVMKHGISHDIVTKPGSVPVVIGMCRLSAHELATLKERVKDLLDKKHIQPSSSPYAASVLFAPKNGGALRMCVDYRTLNSQTVKNKYPLPLVDDLLDLLQAARYFTKMDMTDRYYHIPMTKEDVQKTAFHTPIGHYEFLVMPFGLANAPATFQRLMNDIFADMIGKFVVVYMDDILIYDATKEEHFDYVKQVLDRLRSKNIFVKMKKSSFFQPEVEYLEYMVGHGQVKPDPEKVRAIKEWCNERRTFITTSLALANQISVCE